MAFTKLFASITESTVWCESDQVRIVWITMLAMANWQGEVMGSIPGLANRARVPIPAVEEALAKFMAPDPYSRTKEHEGRRIAEIDGGWKLLTYTKHRDTYENRDPEKRREYMRSLMKKKRDVSQNVSQVSQSVSQDVSTVSQNVSPYKDTDTDKERSKANTTALATRRDKTGTRLPEGFKVTDEIRAFATLHSLPDPDLHIAEFIDYWTAIPGQRGVKLDWPATFRNWLRRVKDYKAGVSYDRHKTTAQLRDERTEQALQRAISKIDDPDDLPKALLARVNRAGV